MMFRAAAAVVLAAGALCPTAAFAAETVTISLTGLQIRNNTPQSRSSAPDTIDPAFQYVVEISPNTSVQGVGGILGTLYSTPTLLSDVLEDLGEDPGLLGGVVDNPAGTHPLTLINETFSGSQVVIGVTFSASLTLSAVIQSDNTVQFSLSNVSITSSNPFFPPGYLQFTEGSLIVTRVDIADCPPCAADFNSDDSVDDLDITDFFVGFEQGDSCADVNQDDTIDDLDITAFFVGFEQGC